jgi:hypothetical protein
MQLISQKRTRRLVELSLIVQGAEKRKGEGKLAFYSLLFLSSFSMLEMKDRVLHTSTSH